MCALQKTFCHIDSPAEKTQEGAPAELLVQIDSVPARKVSTDELCQVESVPKVGFLRRPAVLYRPMRILWNLGHGGVRHTLLSVFMPRASVMAAQLGLADGPRKTPSHLDEALDLKPGDLVEVRPEEEIIQTLDGKGRHYGLVFTPEMRKHCGKRYRVFKRLEFMFDEYRHTQRRLKNTVLLKEVYCTGEGIGCDRSCFLYWREVWLQRVEEVAKTSGREKELQTESHSG
jgi:hypothetical protein